MTGEKTTDDAAGRPGAGPTRRRGAELEQAILRAAVEELAEAGYAGLTMDRVARRAGTNKNAIYRRWPNRAALGLAAYRRLVVADQELPDTGELRGDVLELLGRAAVTDETRDRCREVYAAQVSDPTARHLIAENDEGQIVGILAMRDIVRCWTDDGAICEVPASAALSG